MDIIFKAFHYAFIFGLGVIGAYVAFMALSVVLGVVAALLGSTAGTILLLLAFYYAYKKWKANRNDILL